MTTCRKPRRKARARGAYTFLELAIALGLIAIVFAAAFPVVSATFEEKRLRGAMDAIGERVREWRQEAETSGRERTLALMRKGLASGTGKDPALAVTIPQGITLEVKFPGGEWEAAKGQPWRIFSLGLVQPLSLRLRQGSSWIETDFDVLTGGVAAERYSF